MAFHSRSNTFLLFLAIIILILIVYAPQANAFGAGNIPSFAYLEGKAFRHGDIEDTLEKLLKKTGGGLLSRGSKFGGLDIKRVYFGNWLRDYSQALDVAGLSKLNKQTILNLLMALGFLAHGYATNEFEVTEERIGVYLPVEHIDNPKDYNNNEDARKVHPKLRGPIDPRELETDPRTGMKNYIANEHGSWDTSSACIRRNLTKCIELGRRYRAQGRDADIWEAYRLLGTALHTLEDLPAHSNWCELSLIRLGYNNVFCHVGDAVKIQTPAGISAPLVTGTFGSADFIHSLLGEATDHISEASVSDLNKEMDKARSAPTTGFDGLRSMIFQMPGGNSGEMSRDMDNMDRIRSRANDPNAINNMSPQELHSTLWQILKFRDDVVKNIEMTIEKIPGLSSLVEKISESITKFVYVTIEPYLKPILSTASAGLQQGSAQVLDNAEQFRVFNDPHASDPTHSFLSKDHFNMILNEPAGQLAKIIITHAVKCVVEAWDNPSLHPNQVIDRILEAMHHPYFLNPNSQVQKDMGQYMKTWIESMKHEDKNYVLNSLTKESVRAGKNLRKGSQESQQGHGQGDQYNSFLPPPSQLAGKIGNQIPGFNQAQQGFGQFSNFIGRDVQEDGSGGFAPPRCPPPPGPRPPDAYHQQYNASPGIPEASSYGGGGAGYAPDYGGSYGGGYGSGSGSGPGPGPGGFGFPSPEGPPPPGEGGFRPPEAHHYGGPGYPPQGPPQGGYPPYGGSGGYPPSEPKPWY